MQEPSHPKIKFMKIHRNDGIFTVRHKKVMIKGQNIPSPGNILYPEKMKIFTCAPKYKLL